MFTWNELSALGLIRILKDPELVIYFMKTLKPLRRELVEKESREWHQSLRINQEDRWKSIAELLIELKNRIDSCRECGCGYSQYYCERGKYQGDNEPN